jgi:hypothetical protein
MLSTVLKYMHEYYVNDQSRGEKWSCPWLGDDNSNMFLVELFSIVGHVIPGIGEKHYKARTPVIDLYSMCFEDDIESFADWILPACLPGVKVVCRAACLVIYCKAYEVLNLKPGRSHLGQDELNTAAFILYTGKTKLVLYDEYGSLVPQLESDILGLPVEEKAGPVTIPVDLLSVGSAAITISSTTTVSSDYLDALGFTEFLETLNVKRKSVRSLRQLCDLLQTEPHFTSAVSYRLDRLLDRLFNRVDLLFPGLPACVVGRYSGFDYLYELLVNKCDIFGNRLPTLIANVVRSIRYHILQCLSLTVYDLTTPRSVVREYLEHRSIQPSRPNFYKLMGVTTLDKMVSMLPNLRISDRPVHREWSWKGAFRR